MHVQMLAALLALGLTMGSALEASAADETRESFSAIEKEDAERLRQAGEQACRQAADAAAQLGETFREVGVEASRVLAQAGDTFAREMAPAMRQLADRLQEMAQQMEQSLQERRSEPPPTRN